ncbi:MAG: FtsX-like permease family protein [Bacteroidetes bacterium]|nr:MAG: FtsX-like permease family protein [Bacteroidota bacterium]
MLRNYLIIAWRNFLRNKRYSFINILGLATGLTCFVWIMLYVQDEYRYDRYHSQADRIYRLVEKIDLEGQGEESSSNPFPTGPALANDYPQLVEEVVRFFDWQTETRTLRVGDRKFAQQEVFFVDSSVFKVFDFPLAAGDPGSALHGPNKIVISQAMARKYFGEEDPMGQQIVYEGQTPLQVTGVFGDIPPQSHFHFEAFISYATLVPYLGQALERNWVWNPNWTYVLLREGVSPAELEAQFPIFIDKYYPDFIRPQITHYLQPLTDIHLHSHLDYEITPNGDANNVLIFALIGAFILLIAGINFVNLATARSARRAREVGMRKVLGAHRGGLVRQFLGESLMLTGIALLLSFLFLELGLPFFNQLAGKSLSGELLTEPAFLLAFLGTGLVVGIGAGLYPAYYLSAFRPAQVLKGKVRASRREQLFRRGLVVLQFSISLALIIATSVIYRQFTFLKSADTGFAREQVLVVPLKPDLLPKLEVLREGFLRSQDVKGVTKMNEIIGVHHNVHEYNYAGMEPGRWIYFPSLIVDEYFLETFDLELVAGRGFSRDHPTDDTLAVVVNEAMVRERGWGSPADAIGQQLYTPHGRERVIGVVRDFHAVSLKDKIRPFVLDMVGGPLGSFFTKNLAVRISGQNIPETLAHLEQVWAQSSPEHPFEYSFLNSRIQALYQSEDRLGDLVGYFSLLAIFIACLGLFALASFTAEQRRQEIGIRKVLGASVSGIVGLLAMDYLRLVLIANLIAWPVAGFALYAWLENFAYRIEFPWAFFLLGSVLVLVVALGTVLFQSLRAGYTDPVLALRDE